MLDGFVSWCSPCSQPATLAIGRTIHAAGTHVVVTHAAVKRAVSIRVVAIFAVAILVAVTLVAVTPAAAILAVVTRAAGIALGTRPMTRLSSCTRSSAQSMTEQPTTSFVRAVES